MGIALSTPRGIDLTTRLPAEIKDMIISLLKGDNTSLCACSLVCKDWLPYARRCLFKQLVLTPENLPRFSRLYKPSTSEIATYVQELVFNDFTHRIVEDNYPENLASLKHITSLVFSNTDFNYFPPTLPPCFPNVTDLALKDLWFDNFEDAVALITSFESLKEFSSSDVRWSPAHRPPLIRKRWESPPRIKFLKVDDRNARRFGKWLTESQIRTIDTLDFDTHRFTPYDAVCRLISDCAESIKEIKFDLTGIQGKYSFYLLDIIGF